MNGLRFATYDVFTDTRYAGNPLAVVFDADALSDAQMQSIAREFNLSETIFVLALANAAHEASVRIFTPGKELPFAGHPTIGGAIALAERRHGREAARDLIFVLEEKIGPVRCGVKIATQGPSFAEFAAPRLSQPAGDDPAAPFVAGQCRSEHGAPSAAYAVGGGGSMPRQIFQLKMSLTGVRPPVWRRVLVPGGYNLDRLHRVVQYAFGWRDCHLHSFDINGVSYASFVYPTGRWSVALYTHQLAKFRSRTETQGIFHLPNEVTEVRSFDRGWSTDLELTSLGFSAGYRVGERLSLGLGVVRFKGSLDARFAWHTAGQRLLRGAVRSQLLSRRAAGRRGCHGS